MKRSLLAALVPFSDPRMAAFQRRSFRTELYAAVQKAAKGAFDNLSCRPAWLNAIAFEKLAHAAGVQAIPRKFDGIEGLPGFLKFLGAKEGMFRTMAAALPRKAPSEDGAAEVVAHLITLHSTRQIEAKDLNPSWRIWPVAGQVISFEEARRGNTPLSSEFIDTVSEKANGSTELRRLIAGIIAQPRKGIPNPSGAKWNPFPPQPNGAHRARKSALRPAGAEITFAEDCCCKHPVLPGLEILPLRMPGPIDPRHRVYVGSSHTIRWLSGRLRREKMTPS